MVHTSSSHTSNFNPPFGTTPRNPNPSPQGRKKAPHSDCLLCLEICGAFLAAFVLGFGLLLYFIYFLEATTTVGGLPLVNIAYITVLLRNDSTNPNNMMTSEWGVGFTVENQKQGSTLAYGEFNISIQADTGISTVGVVPGFRRNTTNSSDLAKLNTTVRALLPLYNATNYELRFGVTFLSKVIEASLTDKEYKQQQAWVGIKNKAKLFNGTCANMTIAVQGNHGSVSGPVTCLDPRERPHKRGYIF